ncbi:16S rRNA methyltransferase [Leucobacter sp. UCD-THU]|uniref:16S rRNA (uracil(1498)-N(3))-methyltransferase n=1 Tax=Leucobacter sp. UCD-THU TaxID=1292023 RepID=UPI0003640C13|nr:16S rRNA (uracil(1498)-N(3))-methyltransferase [Leucobacter sp. UCD-THU]EYT52691.1 16S rRNA methyltransferase [Leucobacter sp. UCD-THU]
MANLYYREDLAAGQLAPGALVEVTGDEARHAVRVSRLRQGERILLGDGAGTLGAGVAEQVAKDRFAVRIERVEAAPEPTQRLVLVQALAKGDRDERAVEQATEFGVDEIVPWQAARSVSRWDGAGGSEKSAKGVAKWARVAREASKQSLRARVPRVAPPVSLDDLCRMATEADAEVVALHPRSGRRLVAWAGGAAARSAQRIVLVVGPEGGFADGELDALEAAGASVLVLGDTVLRTSSAGPAALAVLGAALGRW